MSVDTVKQYIGERKIFLTRVKEVIVNRLNLDITEDQIDNDAPLFGLGLGLDSIDILDLVIGLEEEFNAKIPEENADLFRSVNTITDFFMQD